MPLKQIEKLDKIFPENSFSRSLKQNLINIFKIGTQIQFTILCYKRKFSKKNCFMF